MRKFTSILIFISCCYFFLSCNSASPEKYFSVAVLNANLMHGFAGDGMHRQLQSPSAKMVGNDPNKTEPMKRTVVIDSKIQSLEKGLEKVKQLEETEDTKDILQASLALYNYVLPVFKNEYSQLAKLYDDGAPVQETQSFSQSISDKYYSKFAELHDKLTNAGKSFAGRHNLNVRWDIHTSPQ